jgi:hypothetical protein
MKVGYVMGFFRENILKFIIIFVVVILVTVGFSFIITKTVGKKVSDYTSMEDKLVSAAKSYAQNNTSLLPKDEGTLKKISMDVLVNEKKIDQFYAFENEEVACTGYVTITKKDDGYIYKPYLKCGNYYETSSIADYIIKNYIKFGSNVYRIIEIDSDNELKIISTVQTDDDTSWDDRYNSEKESNVGVNDFSKSRLKESLNTLYKSEYFTDSDREKIVKHDLCVGKRSLNDGSIDGKAECSVLEKDQYVGLLQVNEYARASLDTKCTSALNAECQNYNYIISMLKYSVSVRTQTAVLDNTYKVYYILSGELNTINASMSFKYYPVVYLDKDVMYASGDGTEENPYIIR